MHVIVKRLAENYLLQDVNIEMNSRFTWPHDLLKGCFKHEMDKE